MTAGLQDLHEGFDLHRELPAQHPLRSTRWAEANLEIAERPLAASLLTQANPTLVAPPELQGLIDEYVRHMLIVGKATTQMMATALGSDGHQLSELTNDPWWTMRLIHYPAAQSGSSKNSNGGDDGSVEPVGCGAHTDYGLLTIIASATPGVQALEVQDVGKRWVKAAPPAGAFTCNIGDMMAHITGGRYVSTPHRVISHPSRARISVPFFYEPTFDALITSAADSTAPNRRTVVYGKHLLSKLAHNLAPQPPLQP